MKPSTASNIFLTLSSPNKPNVKKSTMAPRPAIMASLIEPVSFHLSNAAVIPLNKERNIVAIIKTLPSIFNRFAGLKMDIMLERKPPLKKPRIVSNIPPSSLGSSGLAPAGVGVFLSLFLSTSNFASRSSSFKKKPLSASTSA